MNQGTECIWIKEVWHNSVMRLALNRARSMGICHISTETQWVHWFLSNHPRKQGCWKPKGTHTVDNIHACTQGIVCFNSPKFIFSKEASPSAWMLYQLSAQRRFITKNKQTLTSLFLVEHDIFSEQSKGLHINSSMIMRVDDIWKNTALSKVIWELKNTSPLGWSGALQIQKVPHYSTIRLENTLGRSSFLYKHMSCRLNPYPPGYLYMSSASRDPDMCTRVGGPSTRIRVHE